MKQWLMTLQARRDALAGWLPQLLGRLVLGHVFGVAGWGKLHHLDKITAFFASLDIPYAAVQAPMVSALEFVGGGSLFLGLGTRIIALPLTATMLVALTTAKRDDIDSLQALFGMSEWLYVILLLQLIFTGGGRLSVDHWLRKSQR